MFQFFNELRSRNETLFYFSMILFVCALAFYLLTKISTTQILGVNAWFKPFKFAVSISIYCGTMAWFCFYLPSFNIRLFNWTNIILFSFEIGYIVLQAARGQESHFNQTTPLNSALYGGMAIAAIAITVYTAYVGVLFFQGSFPQLPVYYLWSIRMSIFIFIIFSFEGLAMGGRLSHSVGSEVQSTFLPLFKWNMKEGDLRVAHFIGMHSLQVIPLLSFYVLKNSKFVFVLSGLYLLFAIFVLIQALQARPFIKNKSAENEIGQ